MGQSWSHQAGMPVDFPFDPVDIPSIVAQDVLQVKKAVRVDSGETQTDMVLVGTDNFTEDLDSEFRIGRFKGYP